MPFNRNIIDKSHALFSVSNDSARRHWKAPILNCSHSLISLPNKLKFVFARQFGPYNYPTKYFWIRRTFLIFEPFPHDRDSVIVRTVIFFSREYNFIGFELEYKSDWIKNATICIKNKPIREYVLIFWYKFSHFLFNHFYIRAQYQ